MEKRHSKRVSVSLNAQIISEGKTYAGVIENISEHGMEYLMTTFIQAARDFTSGNKIEVNFQDPSGEMINLHCEIKWCKESATDERVLIVGMKIISPSPRYKQLINDVYLNDSHI